MYHGKGYTKADVDGMDLDELNRHARRLLGQLEREKEAHEEALRKAKARTKTKGRH